jgi:hypothetical protein
LDDSTTYWINEVETYEEVKLFSDSIYNIKARTKNGCLSKKHIEIVSKNCNLNVEILNSDQIIVYPNPSQNWLKLKTLNNSVISSYQLITSNGQIAQEATLSTTQTPVIDVQSLHGFYLLIITLDNGNILRKTIVIE